MESANGQPRPAVSGVPAAALVRVLDELGDATRGRFFPEAPADHAVYPARGYLDPAVLREHAFWTIPERDRARVDVRAVVSRFARVYCMAVIRPALAAIAIRSPIDASIDRCRIVWKPWHVRGSSATNPFGVCVEVEPSAHASTRQIRSASYRALFTEHLVPVFETVRAVAKVSLNVLWSSAGEGVAGLAAAAAEHSEAAAASAALEICDEVLTAEELPGVAGPNPLLGHIRWEAVGLRELPRGLPVRRVCCLSYTLPDRVPQIWCAACPLPSEDERLALVR